MGHHKNSTGYSLSRRRLESGIVVKWRSNSVAVHFHKGQDNALRCPNATARHSRQIVRRSRPSKEKIALVPVVGFDQNCPLSQLKYAWFYWVFRLIRFYKPIGFYQFGVRFGVRNVKRSFIAASRSPQSRRLRRRENVKGHDSMNIAINHNIDNCFKSDKLGLADGTLFARLQTSCNTRGIIRFCPASQF